jgi:hypothetical protein
MKRPVRLARCPRTPDSYVGALYQKNVDFNILFISINLAIGKKSGIFTVHFVS